MNSEAQPAIHYFSLLVWNASVYIFLSELSVHLFYGWRNQRLRARGQAPSLPVTTLDSDDDMEITDLSDDMALLNIWNCYKRDAKFLKIPKSKIMKYAVFKLQVSSDLLQAGKAARKRGRPQATPKRKPSRHHSAMPTQTARYDKVDHFPSVDKIRTWHT